MLRKSLENYFNRRWYDKEAKHWLWAPLSRYYTRKVLQKRAKYLHERSAPSTQNLPPVLVVGNITVGGTGKTPLVIYLIEKLTDQGLKVAVISRGYGGSADQYPKMVVADSVPEEVGDEPFMIYQRTGTTIVVDPDRSAALAYLADCDQFDVVISDDGLQHYNLDRQYEIVVIDGARGVGNGACLPLGPLREPIDRLATVDAVIVNGQPSEQLQGVIENQGKTPVLMQLRPNHFTKVNQRENASSVMPLDAFAGVENINALAAIGNPQRFFNTLESLGIQAKPHSFPDHHIYTQHELEKFNDSILLMTEKDAVKVRQVISMDQQQAYFLSISAELDDGLIGGILSCIKGE